MRGIFHEDHLQLIIGKEQIRIDLSAPLQGKILQNLVQIGRLRTDLAEAVANSETLDRSIVFELPGNWGSFTISTPHPRHIIENPQVCNREIELNAPSDPMDYIYTYEESDSGGSLLKVIRWSVLEFLKTICGEAELTVTAVKFPDQHGEIRHFPVSDGQQYQMSDLDKIDLSSSRLPFLVVVLIIVAAGVLVGVGMRHMIPGPAPEVEQTPTAMEPVSHEQTRALTTADSVTENGSEVATIAEEKEETVTETALNEPAVSEPVAFTSLGTALADRLPQGSLVYASAIDGWLTFRTTPDSEIDTLTIPSLKLSTEPLTEYLHRDVSHSELPGFLTSRELSDARKITIHLVKGRYQVVWFQ